MSAEKPCPNLECLRRILAEHDERQRANHLTPTQEADLEDMYRETPALAGALKSMRRWAYGVDGAPPLTGDAGRAAAEAMLDEALGPDHAAFVIMVPPPPIKSDNNNNDGQ